MLALAGLAGEDAPTVRAAYISMELLGWFVIVPLSLGSLLTGLIQSLGTVWGVFRHYWLVTKLLITVVASFLLLVHMQPVSHAADLVSATASTVPDLGGLKVQLAADAGAALAVLLVAVALSVFKPQGRTRYGWRKQQEQRAAPMS